MNILDFPCSMNNPTAVALGRFDGVHIAHKMVIEGTMKCKAEGLTPTVFTFSDNPNKASLGLLSTEEEKLCLLEQSGIDTVVNCRFAQVRDLSPKEFVTEVLSKKLQAKKVFCGYNYRFGKDACADVTTLRKLCEEEGISVCCIEEVICEKTSVSSSAIRRLLTEGEIPKANTLLGRRYCFVGKVVHGNGIGRTIDTPTINIDVPKDKLLPKFGVYASYVNIGDKRFRSVSNIGLKPTVGSELPTVEAFLLCGGIDCYDLTVSLELEEFIREEIKFSDTEELRRQITKDVEKAKIILK